VEKISRVSDQTHGGERDKWLESHKFLELISDAARSVVRDVFSRGLSLSFLNQEGHNACQRNDILEDIQSELVIFILENKSGLQNILRQRGRGSHYYLRKAFVNHWIEKTRVPLKDSQRYLYKRAADVLRSSETFRVFTRNSRLLFSLSSDGVPIPRLSPEDLEMAEFPGEMLERFEYSHVSRKKVILRLAGYFWNKISEMWGDKPVCIDIMDFINWIALHVPIRESTMKKLNNEKHVSEILPAYCSTPDQIFFDPELVRKWAGNFANRLSEKEKAVFLLRHGSELRLKDIAARLRYKGSSGPKHPLGNAEAKLRFFLCDLPWLSPDDFNAEAFSLFRDTLLSILESEA